MSSSLLMKQVTQRLRDGRIEVLEVPMPSLRREGVLVDIRASLLSAGTERSKVETGRQNLIGKARSRPDQVKQVVDKARRDGLRETVQAVRARLDQPSGLGYSAAGVVRAVGSRVSDLAPGDRVACAGADYAMHAEVDYVPGNLCVRVPGDLGFDQAAFATVGSIALHGVRQADVRLGERVGVIGLGLVGQLVGQLLRASGCRVIGVDIAPDLLEKALEVGAADVVFKRAGLDGIRSPEATGCDAVIITAATKSSDPIEVAARLCRDRGRVVVVGDVGMEVPRSLYYDKEIELRLSRSYGPGRYDREYEEHGHDYPVGYVRWTERRNMAAFLEFVEAGKVNVADLVSDSISVEDAPDGYERLLTAARSPLGILIRYPTPDTADDGASKLQAVPQAAPPANPLSVGLIGAGSFAQRVLIPGLRSAGFQLLGVASKSGLSARGTAERLGVDRPTTAEELITDPAIGLVAIATRHDSHAELAAAALRAGKNVFVEKPPALTLEELVELREARAASGRILAVGFNRRHAPLAAALREELARSAMPLHLLYRVNAGPLPAGHWLNDLEEGGGRLLGEGCHFVDFACWLAGSLPQRVLCSIAEDSGTPIAAGSDFTIVLDFPGGSSATIAYTSGGAFGLGKEYVEAHKGDLSLVLHEFRALDIHCASHKRRIHGKKRDKGHAIQFEQLRQLLEGGCDPGPDPLDTMAWTLLALESATTGGPVE
jgi:predicted dehydrogenase/threonine dehydrogenase-like Zn-dependent dehydrogenase